MITQGFQRLHHCNAARKSCDARNAVHDGSGPDATFVRAGPFSAGCIEDQGYLLVRHVIQQIGSPFLQLFDCFHIQSMLAENPGCSAGAQDLKTEFLQPANLWDDGVLVRPGETDEDRSRLRKLVPGSDLAFGKCDRKGIRNPHHFARRFHFGSEDNVDTKESIERKHALFDRGLGRDHFGRHPLLRQRDSHHDFGGNLRQRNIRGLRDKR